MTEGPKLVKDSVLSLVIIDSFAERVPPGVKYSINLSSAANRRWSLEVKKSTIDGIEYLSMHIRTERNSDETLTAAIGISLRNERSSDTKTLTFTKDYVSNWTWGYSKFIEMSQVLAENSGFLRNGTLTVQCGVRVYVITDRNGIRKFNFHDPFEGCVRFKEEDGEKTYYAMKELFTHHSPEFAEYIAAGHEEFLFADYAEEEFEWALQLMHGLYAGQVPNWTLSGALESAGFFGTLNVIKRSESLLSEFFLSVPAASKDDLKTFPLRRQLKTVKSLKKLKVVVERESDLLDSEIMKRVARKFFSFAVEVEAPMDV